VIDFLGVGALALVTAEWIGLGWLSGVIFPEPSITAGTWALRLLVGGAVVALAQLLLSLIGVGFGVIPLTLVVATAFAVALRVVAARTGCFASARVFRNGLAPPAMKAPQKHALFEVSATIAESAARETRGAERVGWLLLAAVLVAAGVRALLVAEAGWDAFSHWGLRAQAFTVVGTIVDAHSEHEYYPPLVPLLESWLYLHRGLVSIDLGKTVWAVVGSAFAVCLGSHLRLALDKRWTWLAPYLAVGIVLAPTMLLDGFWTGQADLALTAYLSLATLAAWHWLRSSERMWLVQAAVFSAAAALTKFEGLPRIGVLVAAVLVESVLARDVRMWRLAMVLALAAVAGSALWTAFELTHGIAPNGEHTGALQVATIGLMLYALTEVFGGVRTGGGLLVAALSWLVSRRDLLRPPLRVLGLVVVGQGLTTLLGFLISTTAADIEVVTSATRLFEQFMPLALFVGAVGMSCKKMVHL
jgi:hypothetical protein